MKKGDISLQIVVLAILALLVLGVVAFIFYDQIKKAVAGYNEQREKAKNPEQFVTPVFLPLFTLLGSAGLSKWTRKDTS